MSVTAEYSQLSVQPVFRSEMNSMLCLRRLRTVIFCAEHLGCRRHKKMLQHKRRREKAEAKMQPVQEAEQHKTEED